MKIKITEIEANAEDLDKIIKILVNQKWKRDRFYAWTWAIDENVTVHIVTEESYQDKHRFGLLDWEYYESEE